ncbi:MAG: Icc-related predicted phosphoesterase [Candidatus Woesearchaeota archaeon]|jgi:Icc-related predicted phosphoesterase
MRILAFADLHADMDAFAQLEKKAKKHEVELIVCAGDFTIFGMHTKEIFEKIAALPVPVILIHGNHENENQVKKFATEHKNVIWLHKDTHEYKNFVFIGFGGGGFSKTEPGFVEFAKNHMNKKNVILVTHQPPFETNLDRLDEDWYVGNSDFKEFIEQVQPIVAISGHIHDNEYKKDVIKKTLLINPGPVGRVLEIEENTK